MVPMVSVIVPVFNDEKRIGVLIESLLKQDYPKERYEVIIVDNGSVDHSKEVVQKYPVVFLEENDTQSSYAARNKGIAKAQGEILAFIDSDCVADIQWIKEGVQVIQTQGVDMAGGQVEFFFSEKQSAAEIYDSMTSMRNELYIAQVGGATTANLFVKAKLFKEFGLFPAVKSGGDLQWTGARTKQGCRIAFASKAVVHHPARNLNELLKKALRVGKGSMVMRRQNKDKNSTKDLVRTFLPQKPSSISRFIEERAPGRGYEKRLMSIWLTAYLWNLTKGIGMLSCGAQGPKKKAGS